MRGVLARHVQPPRHAAPPDGEHHVARAEAVALGGGDGKGAVLARDRLDGPAGAQARRHARGAEGVAPGGGEDLLGQRARVDAAPAGERERLRHDQLAARVLAHRAADVGGALEHGVVQAGVVQRGRRGEAGRPGPHDDRVQAVEAGRRRLARGAPRDALGGLPPLLDGVADKAHAAQLARDVEAVHVRLEVAAHARQVHAARGRAEDERDGVRGARALAHPVPHTPRRRDGRRLAADQAQHVALGTDGGARAAAEAPRRVDDRVETGRLVEAGALGHARRRGGAPLAPPPRHHERHRRDEHEHGADEPDERRVGHSRTQSAE